MPVQILKHIRERASQMAYGSAAYNWSLKGEVPERMAVRPVDVWPGDMEAGRRLCEGALTLEGARLPLGAQGWAPEGVCEAWMVRMHGFSWLRDLRALSGERGMGAVARTHAKMMIGSWNAHYENWHPLAWRMDVTGERLAMWLSAYEFFSAVEFIEAEDEEFFQDVFFDSVMRQARHLSRIFTHDRREGDQGPGRFKALKGLLYAGIAFEGCGRWSEQALGLLEAEADAQIAGDGAHRSRSPAQLLECLQVLLDVRMALRAADIRLPEKIQHGIDRMGLALRFFRYNDKHLALFNGGQEGHAEVIDSALRQAGVRGKVLSGLPCSGFERMTLGRTSLMVDCGQGAPWPYDRHAHAGPLSFEMTYGRERLFVNCGSHPADPAWREALRSTPAHSALSIDARNACEIRDEEGRYGGRFQKGRFVRGARRGDVLREDLKHAVLLEAAHDGYEALNGFTHKRRLYLSDQGHDVRGEEFLSAAAEPAKALDIAVRFHLHPRVMVSLICGGREALLRLPGGVGWRFHHSGGALALEDSVYLGQGTQVRKTKQLVIYGQSIDKSVKIKWALQREG
ncbi:MAG: heparinase II/III family protein [Alphaproteobacteria bacterium]